MTVARALKLAGYLYALAFSCAIVWFSGYAAFHIPKEPLLQRIIVFMALGNIVLAILCARGLCKTLNCK